jgi:signal transduction histidine kinase
VPGGVGWTMRREGVMTERRSRMPWVAWVIGMLALAVTLALVVLNHGYGEDALFIPLAVAVTIGWTTVGAMVASRTPGNPTGWLMIAVGVSFVIGGVGSEYATYALQASPEVLPLASFAAWLSEWINVVLVAAVPLLLLVFPTGHLPSPRWRPLAWLIVGLSAIAAAGIAVEPGAIQVTRGDFVTNPIGVAELGRLLDVVLPVIGVAILLASLGAVASVVVRFHRSRGEERQQLRWFAYAAALGAGLLICVLLSSLGSQPGEVRPASEIFGYAFLVAVGVGWPAAIGIAMLKYRLYDLDIVLRKTVIVTVVAAFITVVFLGALVVATVGGGFLLAVPLLLLAFDPVRKRARSVADRVVYGKRATPYEVITSFSERMAETYSTDDVLPRIAQVLQGATGASAATVWLRVGREMRPAASSPANGREEPQPIEDGLPSLPADLAEEVRHQGDLLGALTISMPPNDPIDPPRSKLVRDFAAQAGLVLRNVRLIEELRESRRRIVSAQDERAKALERNIHDGAQQQLVALAVKQRLAASLVHRDPAKAAEILAELQTDTADALEDLRDLARGIFPPLLADKGLAVALESQARKAMISTEVQADSIGRYPQEVEAAVYFCCLEAMQNATKYAGASKMSLRLWERDGELVFSAADDGRGFDKQAASLGAGLQNMTDRISALGGTLEVTSQPGAGVTITGRIPPEPRVHS